MKCKTKINSIYMILFVINFILMFLMLSCVCPYLYVDEAAIGVSTYTLSEFGTDRYGNNWPIYIQNFYGGQSIFYGYLCVPFVKLFGLNIISIRFPMCLLFSIGYFAFYYLLKDEDKSVRFFSCLLYSLSPIVITMGGMALDCLSVFPMIILTLAMLKTAIDKNSCKYYVITAIVLGLTLYTYALTYVILLVFSVLIFSILLYQKRLSPKIITCTFIALMIISFPIILQAIVLVTDIPEFQIGPFSFIKMRRNVLEEVNHRSIKNIFNFVSALTINDYLFADDFSHRLITNIHTFKIYTNFYIVTVPFIFYGFIKSIKLSLVQLKNRIISIHSLLNILFVIGLVYLSTMYYMSTYRMFILIPCVLFYGGYGLSLFVTSEKRYKIIKSIYIIEFILFFSTVFIFNFEKQFRDNSPTYAAIPFDKELEFIEKNDDLKDKKIYVVNIDQNWIYAQFSSKTPEVELSSDDTSGIGVPSFRYKNIYSKFPKKFEPEAVYIITKHYKPKEFNPDIYDFNSMNHKEFKDYDVYY